MDAMTHAEVRSRLKSKIKKDDNGCWVWTGSLHKPMPYGRVRLRSFAGHPTRFTWRAHRASYIAFKGNIPEGMYVCHSCDNPSCINPDHLFLGTHQDNMDDMHAKGRYIHKGATPNNQFAAKRVLAEGKVYPSLVKAGQALGITDSGVKKRIKLGWPGYKMLE